MNDKFTLFIDGILCGLIGVASAIYGFLHWGEEHTALYFAVTFLCGVVGKLIADKVETGNKE